MDCGDDRPNKDKAPVYLPLERWPADDRAAWERLFIEGNILEEPGARAHWSAATRMANRQHMARWLGFVAASDDLDPTLAAADRVTPGRVAAYVVALRARVSPRTLASALIGLKEVTRAIAPDRDWRWLMDLANRAHGAARPSVDRSRAMIPADRLVAIALNELERLATMPLVHRRERLAFRDALMILLLAACPIRLKNFAALELNRHLVREGKANGGRLVLRLAPEETKTARPLTLDVPAFVTPWLDLYVGRIRPSLRPAPHCRRLWIALGGKPAKAHSIYNALAEGTERLVGHRINPHLFRSIAATTLVEKAPADWAAAAPLLGHTTFTTTQRAYLWPDQVAAGRKLNDTIRRLRTGRRRADDSSSSSDADQRPLEGARSLLGKTAPPGWRRAVARRLEDS